MHYSFTGVHYSFTGMHCSFTGVHYSFTGVHYSLLGCTIVLLGCTIVYWVHYSFTGVHCIAPLTFLPGAKHMESLHLLGCMVTSIAIHTQPHSNVSGILIAEREARQLIVQCGGRI